MESDAVFGTRWVDTDTRVELSLCHTTLEGNSYTLSDLTCIRASDVEADDLVICLINQYLGVCGARDALRSVFPLKGSESGMIRCDLISAKSLLCLIFSQTDSAVFEWCEHCGRHGIVVHKS